MSVRWLLGCIPAGLAGAVLGACALSLNGGSIVYGAIAGGLFGSAWGFTQPVKNILIAGFVLALAEVAGFLLTIIFYYQAPKHGWLEFWLCYLVAGWIAGSLIGALGLNPEWIQARWQAAIIGAVAGVLAWWTFFCLALYFEEQKSPGFGWITIIFIGSGWASVVPSAIAGYLLYRFREWQEEQHYQQTRLYKPGATSDQTLKLDVNATQLWAVNHDE